jgi:hypothetical protein
MPTSPDSHEAHDYAERIRERLLWRLQALREAMRLSMYALWLPCCTFAQPCARCGDCS